MAKLNRREFMQASATSLLLGSVDLPASPSGPPKADAPSGAYVRTHSDGRSWEVGNDFVERELRFDSRQGLYTGRWQHKITGTDFIPKAQNRRHGGEEFSFRVDDDFLSGSQGPAWELVEAGTQKLSPSGELLAIHLRGVRKPLDVTACYAVYDAHPVVQKWIIITNRGSEVVKLSHLSFETLPIRPGSPDVLQAAAFYASEPREIFLTGRVDDTAVLERNSLTGEGFIAMNGAPGYTKRTELSGWGDGVQLMYDTDLFPFERRLNPQETFTSAAGSIAFFAEGNGFADPRWVMPSYTSQILMKKGARYQPPWIYNTWEPFQRGISREITLDLIAIAGRMGIDVFTIDDGWQADYGENAINLRSFPNGLEEIQAAVEKQGMRLGLWSPVAAISTNTEVYKQHPEWVCKDRDGNPKITRTAAGPAAVMCLASAYRDAAARRISDLIGRYRLAYVKMDLTTVFNAYGESPGCYAGGHYHQTWAESLERIYEGIRYVTDRIYQAHPDVLLDLTFELWGQKHIIDYGLLAAGDLDWLSNVDDREQGAAGPRQARTLLYLRSLAIPSETMLIGNLQAEMPSLEERLVTAMASGPLFLGDLRKLTAQQQSWYGEKIRWFKALRRQVPLSEGFFPLGNWRQPGGASWDGYARLSRSGEGMIGLFRNESHIDRVTVKLPVFPDGTFHVRSAMTSREAGAVTGESFRKGLDIPFPAEGRVELLEIRK
ncbi:MAG TPA: alpha-galactosidase [Terracidiphilus sp.]|nr:alpha-galactosidase [Terracidiphilus sp.]